jgi:hypothetical protein
MPVAAAGATPHTGTADKLERTEETRVEVLCTGKEVTKKAVEALKMYVWSFSLAFTPLPHGAVRVE